MSKKPSLLKDIKTEASESEYFIGYACVLVAFVLIVAVLLVYVTKLKKQNVTQNESAVTQMQEENAKLRQDLAALEAENESLRLQISDAPEDIVGDATLSAAEIYADDTYNYLAIGNSITVHEITDYWWDEVGMAASSKSADYVHRVIAFLEGSKGEVRSAIVPMGNWELLEYDRAETLHLLDPYLDSRLHLVTIQLGDNVTRTDTFENDFTALLSYIRQKAPDAQIIVVGDYMDYGEKDEIKERVAANFGAAFIPLDAIKGDASYQCRIGTVVYDAAGNPHTVEHSGVSIHPGDAGMQYIADRITEQIL